MYSYERFERLLAEKGVRPVDVAKSTGVSQSTFTAWKKGIYEPKGDKIKAIADYFGVSPVSFYADVVSIPLEDFTPGQIMLAESGEGLTEMECRTLVDMILAFKRSKQKDAY